MQVVYKLQHIPTGLYFRPNRSSPGQVKHNLVQGGHIYYQRPSCAMLKDCFYFDGERVDVKPEEWKAVMFKLEEVNEKICQ